MTTKSLQELLDEADVLVFQTAAMLEQVRRLLGYPSLDVKDLQVAWDEMTGKRAETGDFHGTPNLTGIPFPLVTRRAEVPEDLEPNEPEPRSILDVKKPKAIKLPKAKPGDLAQVRGLSKDDPRRKLPISVQDHYYLKEKVGLWDRIRKVRFFGKGGTTLRVYLTHGITHVWKYSVKGWRLEDKKFTK